MQHIDPQQNDPSRNHSAQQEQQQQSIMHQKRQLEQQKRYQLAQQAQWQSQQKARQQQSQQTRQRSQKRKKPLWPKVAAAGTASTLAAPGIWSIYDAVMYGLNTNPHFLKNIALLTSRLLNIS